MIGRIYTEKLELECKAENVQEIADILKDLSKDMKVNFTVKCEAKDILYIISALTVNHDILLK